MTAGVSQKVSNYRDGTRSGAPAKGGIVAGNAAYGNQRLRVDCMDRTNPLNADSRVGTLF